MPDEQVCEQPVKRRVMVNDKPEEREVPCGSKDGLFNARYDNGRERKLCREHFKENWSDPRMIEGSRIN